MECYCSVSVYSPGGGGAKVQESTWNIDLFHAKHVTQELIINIQMYEMV